MGKGSQSSHSATSSMLCGVSARGYMELEEGDPSFTGSLASKSSWEKSKGLVAAVFLSVLTAGAL